MNAKSRPPSPVDIYLKNPLYEKIDLTSLDQEELAEYLESIEYPKLTLDAYCVGCEKDSVFKHSEASDRALLKQAALDHLADLPRKYKRDEEEYYRPRRKGQVDPRLLSEHIFPVSFDCTRNSDHRFLFIFRLNAGILTKIGQYPSIADVGQPHSRRYRKILGEEKLKELNRAIGLASHGVGIGAYVYLRRIFEVLIEGAHLDAQGDNSAWDDEAYQKAHIDEKIRMLKGYLPAFLVENSGLYAILSKGIHSLSEDECLKYYDIVESGIELILDEKLAQRTREDKKRRAKKALGDLRQKLKD